MEQIENRTYDEERALYGREGLTLRHCRFDGPADGEAEAFCKFLYCHGMCFLFRLFES